MTPLIAPIVALKPDRRSVLAGLIASTFSSVGESKAQKVGAAPDLSRGLNLSHWFAQSERGYGREHLANFLTEKDFAAIVHAGFSHVRLPLEPVLLFGSDDGRIVDADVFNALLQVIARIHRQGLQVVLDLHPVGSDKDALVTEKGGATFVDRWKVLAAAVAKAGLADLTLEILNEPEPNRGEAWWSLQGKAISAIRSAGATGWLIASGGGWSGVDDLVLRQPYADPKLIYTVHCYSPLLFTHQGATWTWDVARDIVGVSWPLAPSAAAQTAAGIPNERSREFLRAAIAGGDFEVHALLSQFDRLAEWSKSQGGAPIYVGEFGVYAKAAPDAARLRWIESVRTIVEAHGWGWALWDASPGFGLQAAGTEGFSPDTAMLQALGLRKA